MTVQEEMLFEDFSILAMVAILFCRMEPFVQFWQRALRETFVRNYFKFGPVD